MEQCPPAADLLKPTQTVATQTDTKLSVSTCVLFSFADPAAG
jgi:hypothetical protein